MTFSFSFEVNASFLHNTEFPITIPSITWENLLQDEFFASLSLNSILITGTCGETVEGYIDCDTEQAQIRCMAGTHLYSFCWNLYLAENLDIVINKKTHTIIVVIKKRKKIKRSFLTEGYKSYFQRDYENALECFQDFLDREESHYKRKPIVHMMIGNIMDVHGHYNDALKQYKIFLDDFIFDINDTCRTLLSAIVNMKIGIIFRKIDDLVALDYNKHSLRICENLLPDIRGKYISITLYMNVGDIYQKMFNNQCNILNTNLSLRDSLHLIKNAYDNYEKGSNILESFENINCTLPEKTKFEERMIECKRSIDQISIPISRIPLQNEDTIRGSIDNKKSFEKRTMNVRITENIEQSRTYLQSIYTNTDNQMICQICKKEMPFRKRNGDYYFEAVEIFSHIFLFKEHEAKYLALCPTCAAKYKVFVKGKKGGQRELYHRIKNVAIPEANVKLGEWETSVKFVESHFVDLKAILSMSDK